MRAISADIRLAQDRRAKRASMFNILVQSLSILLDINLVKLTLLKSSVTRRVTDQTLHPKVEGDEDMILDTIGRGSELVERYIPPADVLKEDIVKGIAGPTNEARRKRLFEVLHKSDNYFKEKKDDIEKAVDIYLEEEYRKAEPLIWTSTSNDLTVLMSYLSDLHPTSLDVAEEDKDDGYDEGYEEGYEQVHSWGNQQN